MNIAKLYRAAASAKLVYPPDGNAIRRAQRAHRRNLAEPGDFRDNRHMLAGLAIAQADVGIRPGWIPEVQRIGGKIAYLSETTPA